MTSAATARVSRIATSASQRPPAPAPWRCTGTGFRLATGSAAAATASCLLHRVLVGVGATGRLGWRGGSGSPSTISKSTTVMLSIPPARLAAATSASAAASGSFSAAAEQLGDLLVAHDVRQPVRADQVEVAGRRGDRQRLDLDGRLGADRARDHRAVRVLLGLLGESLPARTSSPTSE